MSSSSKKLYSLILSSMFLALALVLPFLIGQIPQLGSALSPMHIPVLLCGFFCGPVYGAIVGFIAPLLRFFLFGMPVLLPNGVGMAFELATYGFMAGFMYRLLPKKNIYVYVALITAMLSGRVVWGIARAVLMGFGKGTFGWKVFVTSGFINAIPGIILHIVLIPVLVITLRKYTASNQ